MSKYNTFIKILDQIRQEAPSGYRRYYPPLNSPEMLDQARSRAYIHLYLKVHFGLLSSLGRENLITDGSQDSGINAFFIDRDNKKIKFIQSKFRTSESNFQQKKIDVEELLKMDVERITRGERHDESDVKYSGKIQSLISEIEQIEDIGRYSYEIVLLANIPPIPPLKLKRLIGEFAIEVFDYKHCYEKLIFPVVSSTYFNSSDLQIEIDLSNKVPTTTRINYPVDTRTAECNITVRYYLSRLWKSPKLYLHTKILS